MKMYLKKNGRSKGNENFIPNMIAFTFIRNFLTDESYEKTRKEYFINNLNQKQVSQGMKDIKWLFKEYKGLDVVTIETDNGDITKFIL